MKVVVLFFFIFCSGCTTVSARITYKTKDISADLHFEKNF